MGEPEIDDLVDEAEGARLDYLDAVDRHDLEAAYRLAVERLVPATERLADADNRYHDSLGPTLVNLATVCHHVKRPVSGFYFVQRALHVATMLDIRNQPINEALVDIGLRTEVFATAVVDGCVSVADLPEPEPEMIGPAASLIPRSINLLRRLDGYHAACQLRVAATRLRMLADRQNVDLVHNEARSMVWLARFAFGWGDDEFALAEIGAALNLWLRQLEEGAESWSIGLPETWTVAADLLESLSRPDSAMALRAAINQADEAEPGTEARREHYRVAAAALRS